MADEKDDDPTEHDGDKANSSSTITPPAAVEDDSDPDFDDLDDVLDQFSSVPAQSRPQSNAQPGLPTPSASGPGRPLPSAQTPSAASAAPPLGAQAEESEEAFMARLATEMSSVLGNLGADPTIPTTSTEDMSNIGKELDDFTNALEKQGVSPEDLLKAILGDAVQAEPSSSTAQPGAQKPSQENIPTSTPTTTSAERSTFESTIRRTMERMQASDSHATNAANPPSTSDEEDMFATLLKAMESNGGGGGGGGGGGDTADPQSEDSLSKMFMGMMEQLTNKDMLYEPMKELDSQFPAWLAKNQGKLSDEDQKRYEGQRRIVREIVGKFEERGYTDEDAKCREFIWEKMQTMQGLGSPPTDLITSPFPGMMGGDEGGGGDGGGGGGGGPADDAGCAPQ